MRQQCLKLLFLVCCKDLAFQGALLAERLGGFSVGIETCQYQELWTQIPVFVQAAIASVWKWTLSESECSEV